MKLARPLALTRGFWGKDGLVRIGELQAIAVLVGDSDPGFLGGLFGELNRRSSPSMRAKTQLW